MPKVDVAVQSYRKPESLIYTLFSLHRQSAARVDRVFINDDGSGEDVVRHYRDPRLAARLQPWTISVRVNTRPTGYARQIHTARSPVTVLDRPFRRFSRRDIRLRIKALLTLATVQEDDLRYQWALNSTDKPLLFIIHDDILFWGDVIGLYLEAMSQTERGAIVGDLGQCWVCGNRNICSPERIMEGARPDPEWPLTRLGDRPFPHHYDRACRINEWCCLLDVGVSRDFAARGIYFGNYQDGGDIGAYWFEKVVRAGHGFADPLAGKRGAGYYQHAWQGHSGHSVWEDQGRGKFDYRAADIRDLLETEFGYRLDLEPVGG